MTIQEAVGPAVDTLRGSAGTYQLFAAGSNAGLAEHEQAFGPLSLAAIDAGFMSVLGESGLTGRGGAAFSSWRKVAATAQGRGAALLPAKPVVIANGAEGEPLSFKDKTLLAHAPHLVIDGLLIAGRAVSASLLYIYTTPAAMPVVEAAVAERRDARKIKVVQAPETFISGEASAVVNSIATGVALPLDNRRRLSAAGLKGRPTLVLNVETLAHVALIARHGSGWFRAAGSERDPGTRLVSISGQGAGQVLEVEGDARLCDVLSSAGVDLSTVGAVLVGGYHGRWVRDLECRLSPSGPGENVINPGAGVLHILPARDCGLEATARILDYLARASAKQCGPCMFGLPAMARVLSAIAYGDRNPRLVLELERLTKLVGGRGACHHPDGTARLVSSALEMFAEDMKAHLLGTCTRETRSAI
ncbi:NADH-ubiquinone oxidoreductase-F iron-sulfur binding region domain-containing protein [Arthrobacter sp. H35-D1]|uniref:NADH-ubiquinone oxidoreductase-F iron-sulfur binding region domain-containing protein n=1 Tax=Arthrobacter sp. H35-D1 TaxID=3046202 RepID=UPI0024BB0B10|nr:NADH-ubiquinone oxidoreductase-F iron-sulfur binding region domain-containing protein [Arthrobacter sp. H35-D1]MDJ0314181.1 NADH-ubiquinone oxidoreductase-F iron-sulfur binding region domain-containing protein [Arthrobacter sp. H35-D1]